MGVLMCSVLGLSRAIRSQQNPSTGERPLAYSSTMPPSIDREVLSTKPMVCKRALLACASCVLGAALQVLPLLALSPLLVACFGSRLIIHTEKC